MQKNKTLQLGPFLIVLIYPMFLVLQNIEFTKPYSIIIERQCKDDTLGELHTVDYNEKKKTFYTFRKLSKTRNLKKNIDILLYFFDYYKSTKIYNTPALSIYRRALPQHNTRRLSYPTEQTWRA